MSQLVGRLACTPPCFSSTPTAVSTSLNCSGVNPLLPRPCSARLANSWDTWTERSGRKGGLLYLYAHDCLKQRFSCFFSCFSLYDIHTGSLRFKLQRSDTMQRYCDNTSCVLAREALHAARRLLCALLDLLIMQPRDAACRGWRKRLQAEACAPERATSKGSADMYIMQIKILARA